MRIGFDAKRAFRNATGLGRYSRSLLSALFRHYPDDGYLLYTPNKPSGRFPDFEDQALRCATTVAPGFPWKPFFGSLWRTWGIGREIRNAGLDIYQGLSHELPAGASMPGTAMLLNVHDLIFLTWPGFYKFIDRRTYAVKMRHAINRADCVIALSEHTKREILRFYKVPEARVHVVYPAIERFFTPEGIPEEGKALREKYKLPSEFILYVGTLNARKNLLTLVKALPLMKNRDIRLVAAGQGNSYLKSVMAFIIKEKLEKRVRITGYVDSSDLPALYRTASLFAFPSYDEGFGYPVAEALASGTPAVVSTGSCFMEAGGKGALYADPGSPEAWAETLDRALSDNKLRDTLRSAGISHAARFSDDALACATHALYKEFQR